MNKKGSSRIAAVIDIGSNTLKMCVAQLKKGNIEVLDQLEHPLRLGHEVFHNGKISFDSIRELSALLGGYGKIMAEYGVGQYQAVATTAVREAGNRDYVLDQLRIQNNIDVVILDEEQEKALIYSEILRLLSESGQPSKPMLLSHIGTGSIGMALHNGESVLFSQNISIGSLKLHDMLGGLLTDAKKFHRAVEEYLETVIRQMPFPQLGGVETLTMTGREIRLIAKACGASEKNGRYLLRPEMAVHLFQKIQNLSPEKVGELFGVSEDEAELLYSALIIDIHLLGLTGAKSIVTPVTDLWDALLRQMLLPESRAEYEAQTALNALSCARALAQRYQCSLPHAEAVRGFASRIFDKTQSIHGLGKRERLLLEIAALLTDCGRFLNSSSPDTAAFEMIRHSGIYGLTSAEMQIAAAVAAFGRQETPDRARTVLPTTAGGLLLVSKLGAILRLAEALDLSQHQKLSKIKVKLEQNLLTISGESTDPMGLEKWAFGRCSHFFEEVFGARPSLKIKALLPGIGGMLS